MWITTFHLHCDLWSDALLFLEREFHFNCSVSLVCRPSSNSSFRISSPAVFFWTVLTNFPRHVTDYSLSVQLLLQSFPFSPVCVCVVSFGLEEGRFWFAVQSDEGRSSFRPDMEAEKRTLEHLETLLLCFWAKTISSRRRFTLFTSCFSCCLLFFARFWGGFTFEWKGSATKDNKQRITSSRSAEKKASGFWFHLWK